MRLRRKPWARPELAECSFFIDDPTQCRNRWRQEFDNDNPIHLELGCGKGTFAAAIGVDNPEINYIAIDLKSEVLALAKRKAEELYTAHNAFPHSNLRLMSHDIERLHMILGEQDKVERIYINFCTPYYKERHHKHRLTHTRQLVSYLDWLADGGEVHFKTDDDKLFADSLLYVAEAGYTVRYMTHDLHSSGYSPSYVTEHEAMFTEQGITTKFLIAVRP